MRIKTWQVLFISFAIVMAGFLLIALEDTTPIDSTKEDRIQRIIQSDDFQKRIRDEAERIYYQQVLEEATRRLKDIEHNNEGFLSLEEDAQTLRTFFESKDATHLLPIVDRIVRLPRWVDVVAITGKETNFCRTGVGASKNNCAGIIGSNGDFRTYGSYLDSYEDLSRLLQTERYAGKTIEEMNGTYCVHDGGPCPDWSDHIEDTIAEINGIVFNK